MLSGVVKYHCQTFEKYRILSERRKVQVPQNMEYHARTFNHTNINLWIRTKNILL